MLASLESAQSWYWVKTGLLRRRRPVRAVDGVSLTIGAGEVVGLVGESGAGKSTVGRLLLRLAPLTGGRVLFKGADLHDLGSVELRRYRRSVQAVFQDPYSSFNPRMRIRDIVAEPLRVAGTPAVSAHDQAAQALEAVGIDPGTATLFPHQFSGGQRQRIALARALVSHPELIVLDEPVASLDVSIRGQIINLLAEVHQRIAVSYLLISHDLVTTRYLSDRLYVMYGGQVVEHGPARDVYDDPRHPYTQLLLGVARHRAAFLGGAVSFLPGDPPSPMRPATGCRFHPRCPSAMVGCVTRPPRLSTDGSHAVACHLVSGDLASEERRSLATHRVSPELAPS